jgi:DivIVA domain-containing protein
MDGSPKLITDVQFDHRKRGGYDPDQVDNFLAQLADRVAQLQDMLRRATSQVEAAEAKAAEAMRAQSVAESRVGKLESELARAQAASAEQVEAAPRPEVDVEAEAEHASRVLLMAQKTADATIEDANRTAQHTIADARAKAASMVSEAEGEAERLRESAQRETDELIARQRDAVLAEVQDLEALRERVAGDVNALQDFLDEHRARVRHGIDELQRLLDDPASFRADGPPPLSGAASVAVVAEVEVQAEPVYEPEPVPVPDAVDSSPLDAASPVEDPPEIEPPEMAAVAIAEAADVEEVVELVAAPDIETGPTDDGFPDVPVPTLLRDEEPADEAPGIDLTADRLFDANTDRGDDAPEAAQTDVGSDTELFAPFPERQAGENDDPLGPGDAEADEAMRAFFEADFGDENVDERQKPRFGFRR